MTEDNSIEQSTEQVVEPTPAPKKATAKPSFRRATPEKEQPSFKRAKLDVPATASATTPVVSAPTPKPVADASKADPNSIASLIGIRDYVNNLVNGNFNISKDKIKDLQKISTLIDYKVVNSLLTPEFKALVNFQDADKVILEAARNNTITNNPLRSSLYG